MRSLQCINAEPLTASCLLIEGGLQIPRFHRSNIFLQRIANPLGRLTVANPLGRLTEDRRLTESGRNPWSKNALLTQRNPMKKYPGEEWVKSGEEWCATLHLSEPQCLSGFQTIW